MAGSSATAGDGAPGSGAGWDRAAAAMAGSPGPTRAMTSPKPIPIATVSVSPRTTAPEDGRHGRVDVGDHRGPDRADLGDERGEREERRGGAHDGEDRDRRRARPRLGVTAGHWSAANGA